MKVLKRSQVTRIVTERQVTHEVIANGETFVRYESQKVEIPHMDCEVIYNEPVIKWMLKTAKNVSRPLSAKEVKEFQLNELFGNLDIQSVNGNND